MGYHQSDATRSEGVCRSRDEPRQVRPLSRTVRSYEFSTLRSKKVGLRVPNCELFAGRSLFRMGQSAPGEVAEMDFGRLGWSYSVDFPEGLTLRGIHQGPGNHGSGSAQPSPRPPPRPGLRRTRVVARRARCVRGSDSVQHCRKVGRDPHAVTGFEIRNATKDGAERRRDQHALLPCRLKVALGLLPVLPGASCNCSVEVPVATPYPTAHRTHTRDCCVKILDRLLQ